MHPAIYLRATAPTPGTTPDRYIGPFLFPDDAKDFQSDYGPAQAQIVPIETEAIPPTAEVLTPSQHIELEKAA